MPVTHPKSNLVPTEERTKSESEKAKAAETEPRTDTNLNEIKIGLSDT